VAWSFPIGRLFGIQLRVHATFFLLLAWVGADAWMAGGAGAAGFRIVEILLLFVCVVAHEFGHALTARRFGIATRDVTLLPIGGLARLERMPRKPWQEVAVALAGPAVNVVIFGLAVLVLIAMPAPSGPLLGTTNFADLPYEIAALNLVLAVFNLLPAFPMDGGRVLRALLSIRMRRETATRTAAATGQVLAAAMALYGFVSGNPVLVLIGVFIFFAARAETRMVAMQARSRALTAADAMITTFPRLGAGDSLAVADQIWGAQPALPVVDPASGRPLGFLPRAALDMALELGPADRPVGEIMLPQVPTIGAAATLETVLGQLRRGAPVVAVLGEGGRLAGYVTGESLGRALSETGR
jgi:stage IV sporulation protein FB